MLGIQGCLLSNFIVNPIKLKSVIIGSGVPYQKSSLQRAIYGRYYERMEYLSGSIPVIYQSKHYNFIPDLLNLKESDTSAVAPASIIAYTKSVRRGELHDSLYQEVAVNGRKASVVKSKWNTPAARLSVCRRNMFESFTRLLVNSCPEEKVEGCRGIYTYYHIKTCVRSKYFKQWMELRDEMTNWTKKTECKLAFCLL